MECVCKWHSHSEQAGRGLWIAEETSIFGQTLRSTLPRDLDVQGDDDFLVNWCLAPSLSLWTSLRMRRGGTIHHHLHEGSDLMSRMDKQWLAGLAG